MKDELKITIPADWQEMEGINAQAMEFFSNLSLPQAVVDTYTMMVCELTENGIKYGCQDAVVEVMARVEGDLVSIRVTNKVDSEAHPHLQQLDWTLQRIRGVQDPYQAYLERVREISREPLSHARSGLGLVRMAYEGGAFIDFILNDDCTLNVSAMARLR